MRRRVLALVVVITVVIVLAFAIPLVFLIRNAVAQRADDDTAQIARSFGLALRYGNYTRAQLQSQIAKSVSVIHIRARHPHENSLRAFCLPSVHAYACSARRPTPHLHSFFFFHFSFILYWLGCFYFSAFIVPAISPSYVH